jgi:hypothetical protein
MSGIEVVALVLGVWPMMVNTVSAYKASKDFQTREELIGKFLVYRTLFRGFVETLLLGDEKLSAEDRLRLTDPTDQASRDCWTDKALQSRMEDRLGKDVFLRIQYLAGRTLNLLKQLDERLKKGEVNFVSYS